MVDRRNKPSALATTPTMPPQAQVNISHSNQRVSAVLPTGESVEVLLFGATVLSWKDAAGQERLWLSEGSKLDGSKAVRGGIPLVFPVFGTVPDHGPTSKLPQHGFARTSTWDFLGKSTSEGSSSSVKLDFGLSSSNLDAKTRALWPFDFGLIYSVTLDRESLSTGMVVTNEGEQPFECMLLMHTYLRVKDITKTQVVGLNEASYIDKVDGAKTKTQSGVVAITGEMDRVYTPAGGPKEPVYVVENGENTYGIVRDNLEDVVVWNPWVDKAAGMGDFAPKDGYKNMICVEAGQVKGWTKLEEGDAFQAAQVISLL